MRRAVLACLCVPHLVAADTPRDTPAAIDVDRESTPPGRTELGFDSGAPVDAWGATVMLGLLDRPLELASSTQTTAPVGRRYSGWLGGALAIGSSVVVDARLGLARQRGDRLAVFGDPRALDRTVPLDLRLGARLRVSGTNRRAVFVRGDLGLPTGDDRDFAGDASWTLGWQLIGRVTLPGEIVLAATGGIRLRSAEVVVGDRLVGSELTGALGIAMPLPPIRPLWCGDDQVRVTAELAGALGDDVGVGTGPSPLEARAGFVVRPRPDRANVTIGVRAATALVDDIGAPRVRATLELTYEP